jgi:hypothetical protein
VHNRRSAVQRDHDGAIDERDRWFQRERRHIFSKRSFNSEKCTEATAFVGPYGCETGPLTATQAFPSWEELPVCLCRPIFGISFSGSAAVLETFAVPVPLNNPAIFHRRPCTSVRTSRPGALLVDPAYQCSPKGLSSTLNDQADRG